MAIIARKLFIAGILISFVFSLGMSVNAHNSVINIVKNSRNKLKIPCAVLPKIIEQAVNDSNRALGDKRRSEISYAWGTSGSGAKETVWLSFTVDTKAALETATLRYSWKPYFSWQVDRADNKVVAANELTKIWMETGYLQKP